MYNSLRKLSIMKIIQSLATALLSCVVLYAHAMHPDDAAQSVQNSTHQTYEFHCRYTLYNLAMPLVHKPLLCFNLERGIFALTTNDNVIQIRRISDGSLIKTLGSGYRSYTTICSAQNIFVAAHEHTGIYIWNLDDYSLVAVLDETIASASLCLHPNGRILYSTAGNHVVKVWDIFEKTLLQELYSLNNRSDIRLISLSHDGTVLAAETKGDQKNNGQRPTMTLWDTEAGAVLKELDLDHPNDFIVFSSDFKKIIASYSCSTCQRSNLRVCSPSNKITNDFFRYSFTAMDINPDGTLLAGGVFLYDVENIGNLCVIEFWDLTTRSYKKAVYDHTSPVKLIQFSPNSSFFVSWATDGTLKLWDGVLS